MISWTTSPLHASIRHIYLPPLAIRGEISSRSILAYFSLNQCSRLSTLDSRGKTREQPDEIRVWHARNQLRQPKNENSNAKTCWTLENECPANPPEDARQEPGVKRGSAAASCSPSTNRPMEKRERYHYPLSEVTN